MTKEIELTQGKVALVDDEDYEELNKYKWHTKRDSKRWYAVRTAREEKYKAPVYMHRQILELEYNDGKMADHINRDGLDNTRSNLRVVDFVESNRNRGGYKNNTSGHKGVSWFERNKKWDARINLNCKLVHLGQFTDISDAVEARKQGEIKYWTKEK